LVIDSDRPIIKRMRILGQDTHQGLEQHIPCPPEQPEEQQNRGEIISQGSFCLTG
jgi:hypothetical protein